MAGVRGRGPVGAAEFMGRRRPPVGPRRLGAPNRHRQGCALCRDPSAVERRAPRALDTGLLHKVLGGLSTREYERCAEAVPEAFGLSASTVSRRFKRATARKLRELTERRLEGYDVVALLL